jgi:hypothetical protein
MFSTAHARLYELLTPYVSVVYLLARIRSFLDFLPRFLWFQALWNPQILSLFIPSCRNQATYNADSVQIVIASKCRSTNRLRDSTGTTAPEEESPNSLRTHLAHYRRRKRAPSSTLSHMPTHSNAKCQVSRADHVHRFGARITHILAAQFIPRTADSTRFSRRHGRDIQA